MQTHTKYYQRLTQEPQYPISALRKTGMRLRVYSQRVRIHFSTMSKELCRDKTEGGYAPVIAYQSSETRKTTANEANKRLKRTDAIIEEFLAFFRSVIRFCIYYWKQSKQGKPDQVLLYECG